ncbi:MAG: hypothetical protein ABI690_09650 [Chloroflexota bacterium]
MPEKWVLDGWNDDADNIGAAAAQGLCARISPSPTCTHSWQNTIQGWSWASTNKVPSRHSQSRGVTGPLEMG